MRGKAKIYYLLAFIEGGMIMAFEVIASRLLSPFYGNSLYALTSILGVTLFSLLLGYYWGSNLVHKGFKEILPYVYVFCASLLLIISPSIAYVLFDACMNFGLIGGVLASAISILLIPLFLLGSVSHMLVELVHNLGNKAGYSSGRIFTVSTIGGVLVTFLVGLAMIPQIGVKKTALIIGVLNIILVSATFLYLQRSNYSLKILIIILFSSTSVLVLADQINPQLEYDNCLYLADGYMGRLDVCDYPNNVRILSNNGTEQSRISKVHGSSLLMYTHIISSVATLLPIENREDALLIGMAGGSLVKELNELRFENITAVDVDSRCFEVSEKYFGLDTVEYNSIVDDGRHYLRGVNNTYDLIIIDVSSSAIQPHHLFTQEAFALYKSKLNENGLVIVNVIDSFGIGKGETLDAIANTMDYNNLSPRLVREFYPMAVMDNARYSTHIHERILVGSPNGYLNTIQRNKLNRCCQNTQMCRQINENWNTASLEFKRQVSEKFSDDIPRMDYSNFLRIKKLRNEEFIK